MIHIKKFRLYGFISILFLFCFLFLFKLNKNNNNLSDKNKENEKKEIRSIIKTDDSKALDNIQVNKITIVNDVKKIEKDNYIFPIQANRINKLFRILNDKEKEFLTVLEKLELPSFKKIKNNEEIKNFEYDDYLKVIDSNVVATDKFVSYLNNLSDIYSFNPRNKFVRSKILDKNDKPVIVTAANSNYYDPLQATVFHVHKYFPDYQLIIYDLGLDSIQLENTKKKCKCQIKQYDVDKFYSKVSPHVSDLKKFAWKPLIIQESLLLHKTVLYIDSSIRFLNDEISPIVNTCENIGLMTQYIGLKLVCYTHPKMFEWFEEKSSAYDDFFTIEANILMFHDTFLSKILMKAWVTCAMDPDCIAPEGASTGGCCGCHRFDQDGLTIISSFFFGHPKDKQYLPAYSFTTHESYFFEIKRYQGMKYFD